MLANIVITILSAWVFTEFLSRNHMIHHLMIYAPNKPMRLSTEYIGSTYSRANLLGIGMEWLIPAGILLPCVLGAFRLLGVQALYQSLFVAAALGWGYFMFGYMHDGMHLKEFWMEANSWLSRWFLSARKLHDIHHMELEDTGRQTKNFGICFFFFDRFFGTLSAEHKRFNQNGLEAAMKRYAYIFSEQPAAAESPRRQT